MPKQERYPKATIEAMYIHARDETDGDIQLTFNPTVFSQLLYVLYRAYKYGNEGSKTTLWAEEILDDIAEILGFEE